MEIGLFIGGQLIAPGFGQGVLAVDQRGAHLRWLLRILDADPQQQAPSLGGRVVAQAVLLHLCVVVGTDLGADRRVRRQRLQRRPLKVDDQRCAAIRLADQVLLLHVAHRTQGLLDPGGVRIVQPWLVETPVQAVTEVQRLARLRLAGRAPEGDDVVVGLVRRGDFHQLDAALSPVAQRFDPGARAQVVAVVQVLIAGKLSAALKQAETLRILHAVAAHRQVLRVVQRTPDPLAAAGMDLQAGGVVQFRAIVVLRGGLVGAKQEHAGQRCQAQPTDLVAQEHACLDVDHGVSARAQHETIGAGGARRVEQGEDHQMLILQPRPLDPELAKARELLARRQCRVDHQATGGKTVGLALADHAEVAGAEKGGDLVELACVVDRIEHAEAGVAQVLGDVLVELQVAEIEARGVILDFLDTVAGDLVDLHRRVEMHALVVEAQLERRLPVRPVGLVHVEADLLVVGELHVAELGRQVAGGCGEFFTGHGLRLFSHVVEIEGPDRGGRQCQGGDTSQQQAMQVMVA
ncbi:hypothetical protein SAMN05421755_10517 [Nitrosomonas sp. Nm33]|nr:hypothetical protein SAMN05421755_10517 [Nitrosomonas sp. Nm33]